MFGKPTKQHQWLDQLVGDWTFETQSIMEPGKEPETCQGTHHGRSLGGMWLLGEGQGEMPDGSLAVTLMTLGYDPTKQRFIGTFIGSMMTHLWLYDGSLDATGKILTLDTEGPSFTPAGGMARYQDIIEVISADHHTLSARVLGADGKWNSFMTAHYRRTK